MTARPARYSKRFGRIEPGGRPLEMKINEN